MSEFPPIPEKLSERKIIVYKSRVDPTIVKLTAEKMKHKLFGKLTLSKTRSEEVNVVSVDKYYEPFILIDAKYNVQYFKTRVYTFDVGQDVNEVKISGKLYTPEVDSSAGETSSKVVKLEAQLWSSYSASACLVLDRNCKEITPDQVPSAPSEDHPQKILEEFNKTVGIAELSPEKDVELIKARIVKRPLDASEIKDELFQVSEHAVIYSPVYEITFKNSKTGEERVVKIDGVTAKIIS
ncbi:MAG: hypothetical protein WC325_00815 [Candidatus Bathyarchaeia archaeon]